MFNKIFKAFLCIIIFSVFLGANTLVFAKSACTTSDRKKVMYEKNYRFAEVWDHCGRRHFGDPNETVKCIKEAYPELSDACAACEGVMTACSKHHCMWKCLMNSRSSGCQECAREHCRPALIECTGIADEDLPHFSPE